MTICGAQGWWDDNCLRLAASLAYYTALSLAPLVLLIVGLVGIVLDRQQVASQLAAQLESLMGPASRELVNSILTTTSPEGSTLATVIGLVTLIVGASAVFGELQVTMNLIWEAQLGSSARRKRSFCPGMCVRNLLVFPASYPYSKSHHEPYQATASCVRSSLAPPFSRA